MADKLRNYYRIDFRVRNRKWRWYIVLGDVGVILTNAYIICICINNMKGTPRKYGL